MNEIEVKASGGSKIDIGGNVSISSTPKKKKPFSLLQFGRIGLYLFGLLSSAANKLDLMSKMVRK